MKTLTRIKGMKFISLLMALAIVDFEILKRDLDIKE